MKDPDDTNFDEWIAADLLDELTPEEREAFDLYLQSNPDARSIHHQTTAMSKLLDTALAGARPSPNFEYHLLEAFHQQAAHHPVRNLIALLWEKTINSLRLPIISIPATAAVIIGLVALGSALTGSMESSRVRKLVFAGSSLSGQLREPENSPQPISNRLLVGGGSGAGGIVYGSCIKSSKEISAMPAHPSAIAAFGYRGNDGSINKEKSGLADAQTPSLPAGEDRRALGTVASEALVSSGLSGTYRLADAKTMERMKVDDQPVSVSSGPVSSGLQQPNAAPLPPPGEGITDGRKLVRDASLDLEVKNYDIALDAITGIAVGNSGYVATKDSARLPNGKMSGTVVIKVLPGRLDVALLQIRALGELKNQSLSTRDVTKEYFDTDARLRNARKMEERLLALLDTMKGKITELLAVEKELGRVREQIEQMQGDLKVYDSLVQYATITISLREKDLNEAAAYLLQESVTLSLFSSDVEKTYGTARREAEDAKAQIVRSRIDRDDSGRATAVLSFLVAPEEAEDLIARFKNLGRVQNFNREDCRIPQDGSGNSPSAKVDRDKVQFNLSILQDDESRKQVALTVVTKQVETAFENAKTASAAQGGTLLSSNLEHPAGGGISATLTVRVPSGNYAPLLESFKKAGLVSQFNIQRDDTGTADGVKSPVLILLTLTDANQPIQFTQIAILTPDVESQAARIKQSAEKPGSQAEVKDSTFERTPDGRQTAMLVFQLPLEKYQSFLNEIETLGKMKELSVRRQDRTDEASPSLATAEVTLRLYSQGNVVAEENGLWPTLRKTLGEGTASLMWSVRMIGVAIAFIAPWIFIPGVIIWIIRNFAKRKGTSSEKTPRD